MNASDPLEHLLDVKLTIVRDATDQLEQALARLPAARRRHVDPAVEALGLAIDEIERRIHQPSGR